jgi:hypothetical protein
VELLGTVELPGVVVLAYGGSGVSVELLGNVELSGDVALATTVVLLGSVKLWYGGIGCDELWKGGGGPKWEELDEGGGRWNVELPCVEFPYVPFLNGGG